ncbi:hypothetical protein BAY61_20215 [Prauserella marina]|uniref:Uncharacterized protein n=1 Tax=Prauserella marina TaxID=530584 RepID=A0A222VSV6_9PSEU|nr:hypothetical protein [Prauserella marina]ASR36922.1 hypothetical protein BAY61_20215 [Prauserella marina]PWV80129.1 hypothetical protein DES30_103219 [Prauserella marina]SDD47754.1 hypothetical protein SAMN05421630_1094 [Prauserella marina]
MRRLFWLSVGVAAGVALSRKATETARQATPAGLASNVGGAVRELAGAIGAFGADVRAGMSEREEELNDIVEERAGVQRPQVRGAARGQGEAGRHAAPETRARRARRAES